MSRIEPLSGLSDEAMRSGLARGLPGSPHDFIRELDAAYDLRVHVDALARALEPGDDLRFAVGAAEGERWVLAERLPWDSEFFGRGIARLNAVIDPAGRREPRAAVSADVEAVGRALAVAKEREIDYVFCTVAARDLPLIRTLSASGFELIETRSHYVMPLGEPPETRFETRLAVPADVPSLARAARESVNAFDRFHADVAIEPVEADRMMEAWVEASICRGFADATIVPDVDEPDAFCTAKYHREHWEGWGINLAQPVLSAVGPQHRGWYVRIISELNEHLRSVGADHSWLITQVTNNAVIRSWEKLGYRFGKSEHVFRALL